jgi:hypothetical protein
MTKLIGGARVAVTEGEGIVAGLRKLEEETTFANTPMSRRPGWAERARTACGGRGAVGLAGLKGRVGRLAAGPIGPNVEENFFSNKN